MERPRALKGPSTLLYWTKWPVRNVGDSSFKSHLGSRQRAVHLNTCMRQSPARGLLKSSYFTPLRHSKESNSPRIHTFSLRIFTAKQELLLPLAWHCQSAVCSSHSFCSRQHHGQEQRSQRSGGAGRGGERGGEGQWRGGRRGQPDPPWVARGRREGRRRSCRAPPECARQS